MRHAKVPDRHRADCKAARWHLRLDAAFSWALCIVLAGAFPNPALAQTADLKLQIVDSARIVDLSVGFAEPSGLALMSDAEHYWAVSDDTKAVFFLTNYGEVKPDQSFEIGVKGLEGITTDETGNRLLAVSEQASEVIAIGPTEGTDLRHSLAKMAGFSDIAETYGTLHTNSGLEGIAYDSDRDEVLLSKQGDPRLLIRVSADLSTVLGAVVLTKDLGYSCAGAADASLDISDILYDDRRKVLWVLSDTGSCVLLAEPGTGQVVGRALIANAGDHGKHFKHPEGLALNAEGTELRIITDNGKDSRMFTLTIE